MGDTALRYSIPSEISIENLCSLVCTRKLLLKCHIHSALDQVLFQMAIDVHDLIRSTVARHWRNRFLHTAAAKLPRPVRCEL
jgi:hypothetical protein